MVSGYIMSFTANIITAFRPQIVKSYAIADYRQMEEYMLSCTVYCVGAFALIAVPIFLKMDYVLNLWLGIVPDYAATFLSNSINRFYVWLAKYDNNYSNSGYI